MNRRACALALFLGGCGCDGERPAPPDPVVTPARPLELVDDAALPALDAGDEAVPAITVEASPRGYRVTNREVIRSWPEPERARVAEGAPPEEPEFPIVEADVPLLDDGAPLLVPGLRDALARTLVAERARSGTASAPRVVAIRAASTLAWARVARAVFNAGMVGLSEPWIVVLVGGEARTLRLPPPAAPTRGPIDLGGALRALGTAGGPPTEEAPPAAADPAAPGDLAITVALEDHGVRVHRGAMELGAGCHGPSADGSPAIPITVVSDGHTLGDCTSALGPGPTRFTASPDVTLGVVVRVLGALAARGPVEILVGG